MSEPTSPLATPAAPASTTGAPTAPQSPFAAPPQGQAAPSAPASTAGAGDTSFLDGVSAREPLIKGCVVPGVVAALAIKTSPTTGNAYLSVTATLYGDMIYENGDAVPKGKQLTSSFFATGKDEDALKVTGRKLKNLLLALRNVPLDGKEDAAYAAWPPAEKIARTGFNSLSLAPFEPGDKWAGTKVMVQVRGGKDMDGNPRNEIVLLAACTAPVERKGRK